MESQVLCQVIMYPLIHQFSNVKEYYLYSIYKIFFLAGGTKITKQGKGSEKKMGIEDSRGEEMWNEKKSGKGSTLDKKKRGEERILNN